MIRDIRVALASDLHLEFDADYVSRLHRRARRGDSPEVAEALRRWRELASEPGHPDGPDFREIKALGVDLLLLPGDVHVGLGGVTYADAAARYLGCPCCYLVGNHDSYHGDLLDLIPAAREASARTGGRVTFLEMDRADFDLHGGSRFSEPRYGPITA